YGKPRFLTAIDAPWDGAFVINLLFFKIEIPKEWFKLEYSGTRYMEDQKYALFVALTDRDAARKDENDQKSSLETTIDDAYMTIKEMEQSLQLSKENLEKSQANYELQLNQNKIGLVDFSTLQTARESLYEQETALFEMQIEYGKTLSNFNLQTSGFVNKLLGRAETTINEYEAGQTTGDKASWFVKNNITEYNFTFGVQIPENYGVDEFQLFYGNSPIGEKTKIAETLIHTYVSFGNTEELSLKFFTGGVETYKSTIIGNDYEGELNLIKVAEAPISASVVENVNNLGTWSLVDLDSFRSEFYANFNNINVDFDSIQISYKDKTLTTINKNTSYSTLKLY
ncbi:MAG: TolC family protein, partial [Anaerotignaceae bacterium]